MKCKIIKNEKITDDIKRLIFEEPSLVKAARAGQFVNIRVDDNYDPLLRRPFGINFIDEEKGFVVVLYQIKGRGTEVLSKKNPGEYIDVLGPLGNGFMVDIRDSKVAVVGGGMGIAPLLELCRVLKSKDNEVITFLGFKDVPLLCDEFQDYSDHLMLSTESGTCGYKGFVTEILESHLFSNKVDLIYACGPKPMLKKVSEISQKFGIRCQVSMEEKMGCGIGACLVCACKIKKEKDFDYKRVCVDGPVFYSDEVIFDD